MGTNLINDLKDLLSEYMVPFCNAAGEERLGKWWGHRMDLTLKPFQHIIWNLIYLLCIKKNNID